MVSYLTLWFMLARTLYDRNFDCFSAVDRFPTLCAQDTSSCQTSDLCIYTAKLLKKYQSLALRLETIVSYELNIINLGLGTFSS